MQVHGGGELAGPPLDEYPRQVGTRRQPAPLLAAALVLVAIGAARAPAGTITTVAGGPGTGQATSLSEDPSGVAVWGVFVYLADPDYNVVRRVDTTTGDSIVVAGVGAEGGFSGDGGPATAAKLYFPAGLALDGAGNLFIADRDNQRIRRVDAGTGMITTVAGNGSGGFSGDGGPATAAGVPLPSGLALDGAGNLFIAELGDSRIRRVDAGTGTITTVAGTGTQGFSGDGGPATAAALSVPSDVGLDGAGNLFIADWGNHRLRRVDAGTGTITTGAGSGTGRRGGDGGSATAAQLYLPVGVALDGAGNLFIAGSGDGLIRRVDAVTGTITTVTQGSAPAGVALDGTGNLFIAEEGQREPDYYYGARIRRVDAATGTITTVAGTGTEGFSGDGGPATAAELRGPTGVALDGTGNLFIADSGNARIRRVDAGTGTITTVAGGGTDVGAGGPAAEAAAGAGGVALPGTGDPFSAC